MIVRVFDLGTNFGDQTDAYHDFECSNFDVYNGMLRLMTYGDEGRSDTYIPLTSIKLFKRISDPDSAPVSEQGVEQ